MLHTLIKNNDTTQSPQLSLDLLKKRQDISSLNRYNLFIQGPVSDLVPNHLGNNAYQVRGTDTLNWGHQAHWVYSKAVLPEIRGLLKSELCKLLPSGSLGQSEYIFDFEAYIPDLIQHQEVLKQLAFRRSMYLLEIAAETGDEDTFLKGMHQIDWSQQSAKDFVHVVHLALAAGAHLAARKLATSGVQQYPDHPKLQKMARILAPPRIVRANLPPVPSIKANQAWLRTHSDKYKGQWVALRNGELVAATPNVSELKSHLKSTYDIMVTKVL